MAATGSRTKRRKRTSAPAIRVCDGLSCRMAGGDRLLAELAAWPRVVRAPCLGRCDGAPAVLVGDCAIAPATAAEVAAAVSAGRVEAELPPYVNLVTYSVQGGYQTLRGCLDGRRSPEAVTAIVEDCGLSSPRDGGVPAGRRWRTLRGGPGPRLLVVEAGQGPGAVIGRLLIERDPHRFLEGALIAAWAVDAAEIRIQLPADQPHLLRLLAQEVAAVEASRIPDGRPVRLLPTGLPAADDGGPAVVSDVESLYWLRDVIERGAAWFAGFGRRGRRGFRCFAVSGRVRVPGVKVAPAGVTVRELIEEFSGGMADGHAFRAFVHPGEAPGVLSEALADQPLDAGHGSAVVVLSDRDDVAQDPPHHQRPRRRRSSSISGGGASSSVRRSGGASSGVR